MMGHSGVPPGAGSVNDMTNRMNKGSGDAGDGLVHQSSSMAGSNAALE